MAEVNLRIKAQNQTKTGFQEALRDAQGFSSRASGSMRTAFSGVASDIKSSIGGALAGLASIGALKSIIDQFGRIQDLSEQFNVSAESLQRFGQLASESGSSIEQVAAAFSRLTINIQKAQSGTGAQADALRELGMSAAELANLSPEEAFLRLADALQKAGGTNSAYAAALNLIGNRQRDLIPLLAQGAAAIRAQASAVSAASDEVVAKVDAMADRFQRLGQQFTVGLGPAIATFGQFALNVFVTLLTALGAIRDTLLQTAQGLGEVMKGNFVSGLNQIQSAPLDNLIKKAGELEKKFKEINAPPPQRPGRGAGAALDAAMEDQNGTGKNSGTAAENGIEEALRQGARRKIDQEIAMADAKLTGDKTAQENILQQQDMSRVLESGGTFEQAANLTAINQRQREFDALLANQAVGATGSFGASAFQRIGFASNEFFDTRKSKDPAEETRKVVEVAKQILKKIETGEPLVLPATN